MSVSQRKIKTLVDIRSINDLFIKGKHKQTFPLRLHYFSAKETKTVFTVSKKKLPKAVDRNRIKRVLKDVYFNNFAEQGERRKYHLGFVYLSSKLMSHKEIVKSMKTLMDKINQ
ncbi:MAG: ribonuclease P protein component [Flavobacteriales bacterium]|nr:ribonuclease P protein component [Flavobacteriales bacterium]